MRRYQKARGLTIDGWLAPGGETARNLGRDLQGIDPSPDLARDDFDFAPIGPDRASRRADIAKAQKLLAAAGHLTYDTTGEPDGWGGTRFFETLKAFQEDAGLPADGQLRPEGKTFDALLQAIEQKSAEADKPVRTAMFQAAVPAAIAALGLATIGTGRQTGETTAKELPNLLRARAPEMPPLPGTPAEPPIGPREIAIPPSTPQPGANAPTILPGRTIEEPKPFIEIIPMLEEEWLREIGAPLERHGSERTKKLNTDVGKVAGEINDPRDGEITIDGGGYVDGGGYRKEVRLTAKGALADPSSKLKNGSWIDMTIRNEKTDRRMHINTVDRGMPAREQRQVDKIHTNIDSGDVFITIDKAPKDMPEDRFMDYLRENYGDKLRAGLREIGKSRR